MDNIKSVFDSEFKGTKFDRKFLKELRNYVNRFISKNADSINFFGSPLVGVYKVRYTREDRDKWFLDLLDVNEIELKHKTHSLNTVNPEFAVSSDINNISYTYLVHRFMTSTDLKEKERIEGARLTLEMMFYKFITSLLYNLLPHGVDKSLAIATYAALSRKFDLRVAGSWKEMIYRKSLSMLDKNALHYNTIMTYDDDDKILYIISDSQTRIRKQINIIVDVFYSVYEKNAGIGSEGSIIELDEESFIKDKRNKFRSIIHYVQDIIKDKNSFIKDDLVEILLKFNTTTKKFLVQGLEYICDNHGTGRRNKYIDETVDEILIVSLNFLASENIELNDLPSVLLRLKGIIMSSNQKEVLEIKDSLTKLVDNALDTKNETVKSSVRICLFLYIVLRALTKDHYSK